MLLGNIQSILPNAQAGFIENENKKAYFFLMKDFKVKPEWVKVGQAVNFFLEEGFDKKE